MIWYLKKGYSKYYCKSVGDLHNFLKSLGFVHVDSSNNSPHHTTHDHQGPTKPRKVLEGSMIDYYYIKQTKYQLNTHMYTFIHGLELIKEIIHAQILR